VDERRLIQAVPISIAVHPATASSGLPERLTSRGVAVAASEAAAVTGRNRAPACSGVAPPTPCRYWVMKKKKLSSAPLNRNRAA
jgi:hypothetical protein